MSAADHADAWDLAHFRCETSNLARAYIELRQVVKRSMAGDAEAHSRLREINATSDDSVVRPMET